MIDVLRRIARTPSPGNPHGYLRDVEQVELAAREVLDRLWDEDPRELHALLTRLAGERPAALAQITVALAAWMPRGEDQDVRRDRAEQVTAPRDAVSLRRGAA